MSSKTIFLKKCPTERNRGEKNCPTFLRGLASIPMISRYQKMSFIISNCPDDFLARADFFRLLGYFSVSFRFPGQFRSLVTFETPIIL